MANYSFDYGNSHWTFLDSNVYVDWSDVYLRNWLARDLAAAKDATWKFGSFTTRRSTHRGRIFRNSRCA